MCVLLNLCEAVYLFGYLFAIVLLLQFGFRVYSWVFSFFKDFIYLFLEREEWEEKERKKNLNVQLPLTHPTLGTRPATQACALTGN